MARRWVTGLVGVLAIAGLIGVGYSAFTATATVNGNTAAASVSLTVHPTTAGSCSFPNGTPASGSFTFSENAAQNVLSVGFTNLEPGGVCSVLVQVTSTATVPLVLSDQLNESSGICAPGPTHNCYDVADSSGLTSVTPVLTVSSITTLAASGSSYIDNLEVYIPSGSTSAPATGSFAIEFIGSAGI